MNHINIPTAFSCSSRTPRLLVERKGDSRRVGVLAGIPSDATKWQEAVARITKKLKDGQVRLAPYNSTEASGRGDYIARHCGYAHGGGRPQPSNIQQRTRMATNIMAEIMGDDDFEKLAWFQSGLQFSLLSTVWTLKGFY